jgi:hypothetical protein
VVVERVGEEVVHHEAVEGAVVPRNSYLVLLQTFHFHCW